MVSYLWIYRQFAAVQVRGEASTENDVLEQNRVFPNGN